MFDFHKDKNAYFNYQYLTTSKHILPFIEQHLTIDASLRVLEIGCAEAGVLKAFTEKGCSCMGIELSEARVKLAEQFMEKEKQAGLIRFLSKDIYDVDVQEEIGEKFDLILLKDVIEHIHGQERLIKKLQDFLNPGGMIFFAFPPWQMPFGGHQQLSTVKPLSLLPYYHMLPAPLYSGILKAFGEKPQKIESLLEIKSTGISIERFEKITKKLGFELLARQFYLFNPIYEYKFNLKPRKQFGLISKLPVIRNFLSTCAYYLIRP